MGLIHFYASVRRECIPNGERLFFAWQRSVFMRILKLIPATFGLIIINSITKSRFEERQGKIRRKMPSRGISRSENSKFNRSLASSAEKLVSIAKNVNLD